VLSCSIGTNETILLGGINIGRFTKEGFLEYLLENSFLNHDFFVLEEGLDMPPQVLAVLKDILTAGEFRAGGQTYPVKTKMSVICTNKSIAEVATDKSITAIFERFVFKNEVKWTSHEKADYFGAARLFFNYAKNKTGVEVSDDAINRVAMATVLSNSETKKIISPRIMIAAVQAYIDNGSMEPLNFIEGYLGKFLVQNSSEIQREKIMKEYNKFINYVPTNLSELINLHEVKQAFSDYVAGIEYQAANIELKELMDAAFDVQEQKMEKAMGFTKVGQPSNFKDLVAAELGCTPEELRTVGVKKWADASSISMEELAPTVEWLLSEANA
jgi:hypothetical protein